MPARPAAALRWFADERVSALLLVQHGVFFAIGVLLWSTLIDHHPARTRTLAWLALFSVGGAIQIAGQCEQYNQILSAQHSWVVACACWLASLGAIAASVKYNALLARAPASVTQVIALLARIVYPLYLVNFNISRLVFAAFSAVGLSLAGAIAVACVAAMVMALLIAVLAERPLQDVLRSGLRRLLSSASLHAQVDAHTKV